MGAVCFPSPWWPRAVLVGLLVLPLGEGGRAMLGDGPPIHSQVLDAQTGQPVAGAVVLAIWDGAPDYTYYFLGTQEAVTDAEGRFTLNPPREWAGPEHQRVTVYKFGYLAWNNLRTYPRLGPRPDLRVPAEIRLEPFPPGESHRRHWYFLDAMSQRAHYRVEKFGRAIQREWDLP